MVPAPAEQLLKAVHFKAFPFKANKIETECHSLKIELITSTAAGARGHVKLLKYFQFESSRHDSVHFKRPPWHKIMLGQKRRDDPNTIPGGARMHAPQQALALALPLDCARCLTGPACYPASSPG